MRIKHYKYNAFIIENEDIKITIDPDYYWFADKVAEAAGAPIICGKDMVKIDGSKTFILDPRGTA